MAFLQGRLFGVILWKNFLLMSEKRLTLLALLAVSVLTACLLIVSRQQSGVTVVPKTAIFPPHSPYVCLKAGEMFMYGEPDAKHPAIAKWMERCHEYFSFASWRVLYTPDVEITRTIMGHLNYYDGL